MLNLTDHDIALIAESGEKMIITASGYVARVEYERTTVVFGPAVDNGDGSAFVFEIVEQTHREIVIVAPSMEVRSDYEMLQAMGDETLLLVEREVAEAAAWPSVFVHDVGDGKGNLYKPSHPLASRMVWPDGKKEWVESCSIYPGTGNGLKSCVGYRELRRVGGVK